MREEPGVILEPENYTLLVSTLAEIGCFTNDSDPIECAKDIGYENDCGPNLLNELLNEMSEDVLEISSASARRLHNALVIGFKSEKMIKLPKPIHSLAGVPLNNEPAENDELIVSRVSVGNKTGLCPRSGIRLRLINLEKEHRSQLHSQLMNLSDERYQEFIENRKFGNVHDKSYAAKNLNDFSNWLE